MPIELMNTLQVPVWIILLVLQVVILWRISLIAQDVNDLERKHHEHIQFHLKQDPE